MRAARSGAGGAPRRSQQPQPGLSLELPPQSANEVDDSEEVDSEPRMSTKSSSGPNIILFGITCSVFIVIFGISTPDPDVASAVLGERPTNGDPRDFGRSRPVVSASNGGIPGAAQQKHSTVVMPAPAPAATGRGTLDLFTSSCGMYDQTYIPHHITSLRASTTCSIHYHVLTDDPVPIENLLIPIRNMIRLKWRRNMQVSVHDVRQGKFEKGEWKRCASLRFSIPTVHQGPGVYVDADTSFNDDLCQAIPMLDTLDNSTWAAMAAENGPTYTSNKHYRDRYYGTSGVNTGVFFFHTIPGAFIDYMKTYKGPLRLGDQDVINAYFHEFPKQVRLLPCDWNVRMDSMCENRQPIIIHGNRGAFSPNQPWDFVMAMAAPEQARAAATVASLPACTERPHPTWGSNCSSCLKSKRTCGACSRGGFDCHCSC
tara:strand:- start:491 stop:1774 length:1284 start_codon:yes stop_codon:yes gene_type:complete